MLVPSMLNMADVMAVSDFTEEDVFDCGISGQIIFLVVVPLIGACRVPVEALSHFMAGADDYAAEGMPEHWSGALSGKWTIKRDRLRILPQSWEAFSYNLYKLAELAESLDAASEPKEADASAAKGEAGAVITVSGDDKPWLVANPKDPEPAFPWYTPARYFARQLVIDDSTLLVKKLKLAEKIADSLAGVGIFKRGKIKKPLSSGTVLKSFVNVALN